MLVRLIATGFLAALLLSANTPAQEAAPDADSRPDRGTTVADEEVIVRGQRLSEIEFDLRLYIQRFIAEVAAPARARGFARWHRSVCVGVHNLRNDLAQYIVDRISTAALDVGLETGEPGCRPQINIVFASDGQQLAANMVEREPRVFRPVAGNAGMDLGLEALDDFVESQRPVRWWDVSVPIAAHTGQVAIEPWNVSCPRLHCFPWIPVAGPSRLHSGIRDDLQYVIVIVDATAMQGTTWQQLADYLTVVSLAQIDPKTNPEEFDTILNLFSNPAAYSGLTDWDVSYLRALYTFPQERIRQIQGNEIVNRIARQELAASE